ncbi:MAG: hypothetical protein C4329_12700 [Chitinophagaceae bacterium]
MKPILVCFFTILFAATNVDVQNIVGIWKGTSICQVKSSPCHDEVVVYHIKASGKPNEFSMQMNKIVNGAEEDMATLPAV